MDDPPAAPPPNVSTDGQPQQAECPVCGSLAAGHFCARCGQRLTPRSSGVRDITSTSGTFIWDATAQPNHARARAHRRFQWRDRPSLTRAHPRLVTAGAAGALTIAIISVAVISHHAPNQPSLSIKSVASGTHGAGARDGSPPGPRTLTGLLDVLDVGDAAKGLPAGESCNADYNITGATGYDVSGAQAMIEDERGITLAVGTLPETGVYDGNFHCEYRFIIPDVPTDAKFFHVLVGSHNGPSLSRSQMEQAGWTVQMRL